MIIFFNMITLHVFDINFSHNYLTILQVERKLMCHKYGICT